MTSVSVWSIKHRDSAQGDPWRTSSLKEYPRPMGRQVASTSVGVVLRAGESLASYPLGMLGAYDAASLRAPGRNLVGATGRPNVRVFRPKVP
jgi:hypothetical protein